MGIDNLGKEMVDAADEVRKGIAEELKQRKKTVDVYKEYRKVLTGVLIDLHWLRILGANSKIVSANVQMMGEALGYLIDMILLPLLPAMMELVEYIIGLANWFSKLPKDIRMFIAVIAAGVVSLFALATVIYTVTSALEAFTIALGGATAATAGEAATEGAAIATVGGGLAFGAAGLLGVGAGLGMGYLYDKILGPGPKASYNRYALVSKLFGRDIPLMAEGGVATKPTLGIFGEKGAEAIIPLSKIGEVLGGILGTGMGFVNTLTQAASGALGAGAGGGLTTGGSPQSIMAKGFSWVANSINAGFKTTNELLAAILALLAQGGAGGGGLDPIKLAQDIWSAIVAAAKVAWDLILSIAKGVWDIVLVTAKTAWDTILDIAQGVWNGILSIAGNVFNMIFGLIEPIFPGITDKLRETWDNFVNASNSAWDKVREKSDATWDQIFVVSDEVWEKIKDKQLTLVDALLALLPRPGGTPSGTPTGTPGPSGPPIFEGLQKVFENGVYIGDWELYSDGSKKWRPNPNAKYAGTTEAPIGENISTLSAKQLEDETLRKIQQGADDYAREINEALNNSSKKVNEGNQEALTKSQQAEKDIVDNITNVVYLMGDAINAIGHTIWNTVTDAAQTVSEIATNAVTGLSDWLSTTPAGRGPTISTAITGGFTAKNALGSLGVVGGGATAVDIAARVLSGAVNTIGADIIHSLGIPGFQYGGTMPHTGFAFLHKGEVVVPAGEAGKVGGDIIINNPIFQISGKTDRELFESFMRLMKIEGARLR